MIFLQSLQSAKQSRSILVSAHLQRCGGAQTVMCIRRNRAHLATAPQTGWYKVVHSRASRIGDPLAMVLTQTVSRDYSGTVLFSQSELLAFIQVPSNMIRVNPDVQSFHQDEKDPSLWHSECSTLISRKVNNCD